MEFLQATMGYHFSRAEEVRALVAQPAPETKEALTAEAAERLEQVRFPSLQPLFMLFLTLVPLGRIPHS